MPMSLTQAIMEDQKDSDKSSSTAESSNNRFRMKSVDDAEIASFSNESDCWYGEEGYESVDCDRC